MSKSELISQTLNSNAIAHNGGVDPFLAYADAIAPRNIVGTLMKFNKGDYLAGEEGKVIAPGTKLTANVDELLAGLIKWQDGKPVEQRMIRVADGVSPAVRADLGDMDESLWETDDKGEPKDPWQPTNYLPLMDADGNLFTFTTSSRGGLRAVGELVRRYAWHRKNNPDVHPVIALGVGSYKHTNKAYGIIKFPELSPAGYEHKGKFAAAMAAAGFAVSETVPAAEEADDMSDEITF
jgi:hypothetical protein